MHVRVRVRVRVRVSVRGRIRLRICMRMRLWAYGVVVSMFDFHRSDRGSNPGRGGKISCLRLHYNSTLLASV